MCGIRRKIFFQACIPPKLSTSSILNHSFVHLRYRSQLSDCNFWQEHECHRFTFLSPLMRVSNQETLRIFRCRPFIHSPAVLFTPFELQLPATRRTCFPHPTPQMDSIDRPFILLSWTYRTKTLHVFRSQPFIYLRYRSQLLDFRLSQHDVRASHTLHFKWVSRIHLEALMSKKRASMIPRSPIPSAPQEYHHIRSRADKKEIPQIIESTLRSTWRSILRCSTYSPLSSILPNWKYRRQKMELSKPSIPRGQSSRI